MKCITGQVGPQVLHGPWDLPDARVNAKRTGRRWFAQTPGAEQVNWQIFEDVRRLRQPFGYRDKYMALVVPTDEVRAELGKTATRASSL